MTEPKKKLPPAVVGLGLVSFLTDASSEMVYPLVPLFLTTVLPGSVAFVGLVEGVAETTATLLKLVSGRLADKLPQKKPIVLAGYGLSAIVRPFLALAVAPWHVLAVRFAERIGKGIRGVPRDAIVADVTPASERGAAYGYQRGMDNAGAVLGPLLGLALLVGLKLDLRTTFLCAAVPGLLAIPVILFVVREPPHRDVEPAPSTKVEGGAATPTFKLYLLSVGLFTLGNASDAFLLVRAAEVLHPGAAKLAFDPTVMLLWATHNAVKALLSKRFGALSDRLGRRPMILAGWTVYALCYAGFAFVSAPWQLWALFAAYGLYYAMFEGAEKALVADLAPPAFRGRAFAWLASLTGVLSFPASLLFGFVYARAGAIAAFGVAAALAFAAMLTLSFVRPPPVTT